MSDMFLVSLLESLEILIRSLVHLVPFMGGIALGYFFRKVK